MVLSPKKANDVVIASTLKIIVTSVILYRIHALTYVKKCVDMCGFHALYTQLHILVLYLGDAHPYSIDERSDVSGKILPRTSLNKGQKYNTNLYLLMFTFSSISAITIPNWNIYIAVLI